MAGGGKYFKTSKNPKERTTASINRGQESTSARLPYFSQSNKRHRLSLAAAVTVSFLPSNAVESECLAAGPESSSTNT